MQLQHPQLIDLLKKAYSAEKAAAFAYQGHAASVKNPLEKAAIRQIELDEWQILPNETIFQRAGDKRT